MDIELEPLIDDLEALFAEDDETLLGAAPPAKGNDNNV